MIVGIENRDGNANVQFHKQDTLERMFLRLEGRSLKVDRARMDCGSCSEEIVKMIKKPCKHFYICADIFSFLYDDVFVLRRWKKEEINGQEFEQNSILMENGRVKHTVWSSNVNGESTEILTFGRGVHLTMDSDQ